ncbi:CBS domain-containing protein [uncultured Arcticibacterium sp.]|uniref:CBS domain-containing protein n=1 Tax=uncultured Arcticibacterium sp. TaxID=2173042 RepID=UPI0030F7DB8D
MLARDLIEKDLPALDIDDKVGTALIYMEEENLNQLVLVHEKEVLGVIEKDILFNFDEETKLSLVPIKFSNVEVKENQHLLLLAEHCINRDIEVCPVVDFENKYLGSIKTVDIYKKVIAGQFSGNGGLMSLEISEKDYSLSDISRIIETEGLRIEKLYLSQENQNDYHFIIKLNKKEIDPAINSLKRFGYKVAQINERANNSYPDLERYEQLMKYLEI